MLNSKELLGIDTLVVVLLQKQERERERERDRLCVCVRKRERERERERWKTREKTFKIPPTHLNTFVEEEKVVKRSLCVINMRVIFSHA